MAFASGGAMAAAGGSTESAGPASPPRACARVERLRATQTPVGAETFDAVFAWQRATRRARRAGRLQASSAMAERLAPPTDVGAAASRAHARRRRAWRVWCAGCSRATTSRWRRRRATRRSGRPGRPGRRRGSRGGERRARRVARGRTGTEFPQAGVKQRIKARRAMTLARLGQRSRRAGRARRGKLRGGTSAPLGSSRALDLSLAGRRGARSLGTSAPNPNGTPTVPARRRGGARRETANLRASAAFGSLTRGRPQRPRTRATRATTSLSGAPRAPSAPTPGRRVCAPSTDPETAETRRRRRQAGTAESAAAEVQNV